MSRALLAAALLALTISPAWAQRGSIHYSTNAAGRAPYTGQMTPAYTGRSAPYTGRMTPAYTGQTAPYTGRPVTGVGSTNTSPAYNNLRANRVTEQAGRALPVRNIPQLPTMRVGDCTPYLPVRHNRVYYPGGYYYYYNGYYFQDNYNAYALPESPTKPVEDEQKPLPPLDVSKRFELVNPAEGTIIDELPVGTTEVKKSLYKFRETYYRPTYEDGEVKFIVSKP
jgi:hypothetical protein